MAAFRLIQSFRTLSINNKAPCLKLLNVYCQQMHQKFYSSKLEIPTDTTTPAKKKKTVPVPKITLVSPDESIQVVSFEDAQKISKRRDLKLVKIIDLDTKTQRPVYKLMTGAEFHAEDLKQREIKKEKRNESIKGEKLLLINSKISDHDLESRIKNILKWINKKYEIRVVISGDITSMDTCERLYNIIDKRVSCESKILQKRTKGNELKFHIHPPKNPKPNITENL